MPATPEKKITLGWREWLRLPDLDVRMIKAKIDSGARTSALHAFDIRYDEDSNRVTFRVQPRQKTGGPDIECSANVIDRRTVTNSGGQQEERYVIRTTMQLGDYEWPIEVTLTPRHGMKFRMLLGRTALRGLARVDPARSYLVGRKKDIRRASKDG